jgi:hypothetical protein
MQTYTIYIGCNNDTGKLELEKIEAIAGGRHDGFTLYTASGYWLGSKEPTAVLVIHDDPGKIIRTITDLKIELDQDAIGYQVAPTMNFA